MKRLVLIGAFVIAAALPAGALAAAPNNPSCWGAASADLAQSGTGAMGQLYKTELPPIQLEAEPFIWAAVFGIGISFAGAALPARKAARLPPLDAMRDVLPDEIEGFSKWFTLVGAATVIICASARRAPAPCATTPSRS